MAASWRDYLPKVLAVREAEEAGAVSAVSSVSPETGPNRPNRPNGTLPAEIVAGLDLLRSMPCPRKVKADAWPGVVRDALVLAEGWAFQALALGWSAVDLFGAVLDPAGDHDADGLAVKLGGRRVVAVCSSFATVDDGNGGRAYLYRGNTDGARLLWTLGRNG